MSSERYAIYRADDQLEGGASFCLEVPPELVKALEGLTPEQMAEIADAAVCLGAGLDYLRRPFLEDVVDGYGSWAAESLRSGLRGLDKTRAGALRKLAEQVDPQAGEAPV